MIKLKQERLSVPGCCRLYIVHEAMAVLVLLP